MSRLWAKYELLYYPTSLLVIEATASFFEAPNGGRSLDPCAGQGEWIDVFSRHVKLTPYAIELAPKRAAMTAALVGNTLCDSYQNVTVTDQSISVALLNPPYDDSAGDEKRLETEFLRLTTPRIVANGWLVFIVPDYVLSLPEIYKHLIGNYEDFKLFNYPESKYKQVVLFARRKKNFRFATEEQIKEWMDFLKLPIVDISVQDAPSIKLPGIDALRNIRFYSHTHDSSAMMKEALESGVSKMVNWRTLIDPNFKKHDLSEPAMPLKKGHIAMILASGIMGNVTIQTANGHKLTLKGRVVKTQVVVAEGQNDDGETNSVTSEDRFEAVVSYILDGEVRVIKETEELAKFLEEHGEAIAKYISMRYKPMYNFDPTPEETARIDTLSLGRKPLPGQTKPGLLPSQKHVTIALARAMKKHGSVNLQGEMGVGKSGIGAALLEMGDDMYPALLICPPHLVKKWIREIEQVIPGGYATEITRIEGGNEGKHGVNDVDSFLKLYDSGRKGKKMVAIISNSMLAMGPKWEHRFIEKKDKHGKPILCCPQCGNPILVKDDEVTKAGKKKELRPAFTVEDLGNAQNFCVADVPGWQLDEEGHVVMEGGKRVWGIRKCRAPLFTYIAHREGIASYILNHKKHVFKTLVADEVHQYKAEGTDRGVAFGQLTSAVEKVISMTGTYFGGKASSIYWLMYRTSGKLRQDFGFHEVTDFVRIYGRLQVTKVVNKQDEAKSSGRNGTKRWTNRPPKELPGVSPAIISHLLHNTVFISITDLNVNMSPYTESVAVVETGKELGTQLSELTDSLKSLALEDHRNLSTWLQWGLSRPNSAFRDEEAWAFADKEDVEKTKIKSMKPALTADDHLLPKERWLINFLGEQKALGNKVLVYLRQTGTRDIQPRLEEIIKDANLRPLILNASINARKREQWIDDRVAGIDVLITNPKLVETGLDLIKFNVVVFYEIEYSLYTLWQALRRVWRLGQTKPVLAVFSYYKNSMEEIAIKLIGAKMKAGQTLYGDNVSGAIVEQNSEDLLMEMARNAINGSSDLPDLQSMFGATKMEISSPMGSPTMQSSQIVSVPAAVVQENVIDDDDIADIWAKLAREAKSPRSKRNKSNDGQITLF